MLELAVKELIIEVLRLEDIAASDIDSAAPLFAGGLALDSIDLLELCVALRERHGIVLPADPAQQRRHFTSVRTIAALIASQAGGKPAAP